MPSRQLPAHQPCALLLLVVLLSYGGVSAGVTAGSSGNMDKAQSVVDEIIAGGGEAIPDGVSPHLFYPPPLHAGTVQPTAVSPNGGCLRAQSLSSRTWRPW